MLNSYKDSLLVAIQLTQKCARMFLQRVTKADSPSIIENQLSSKEFASLGSLVCNWTKVSSLDKQERFLISNFNATSLIKRSICI